MPVPVVRAKIRRWTVLGKQLAQRLQNIVRLKPASHHDRQALPAVLIQHRQHLERPSIMRPVRHEVIRPYVALVQGPQSDTRTVGQPQPWYSLP